MMKISVLLFGNLAQITGTNKIELEEYTTIEEVKDYLFDKFPTFKTHVFVIAVNQKITKENLTLQNSDEIALLPPFAGG